ncbi:TMhelix containing protein [Vibrio phage 1.213.O._10N.222.54.F10]|nr:TMhelix containing protein [Vibrio phage 1.213.O._10N.222.54.F10]
MKSKNVQMRVNPELYAQFKRVDGESNNERMSKLLSDSEEKYELLSDNYELNERVGVHERSASHWLKQWQSEANQSKTLASALVVSIAVSVCSVAYVCATNGWLS